MPFALSLIIALFILTRLIQIPFEASARPNKVSWLVLISLISGILIGLLTLLLIYELA